MTALGSFQLTLKPFSERVLQRILPTPLNRRLRLLFYGIGGILPGCACQCCNIIKVTQYLLICGFLGLKVALYNVTTCKGVNCEALSYSFIFSSHFLSSDVQYKLLLLAFHVFRLFLLLPSKCYENFLNLTFVRTSFYQISGVLSFQVDPTRCKLANFMDLKNKSCTPNSTQT